MAEYRAVPGVLEVIPLYPTGQNYFTEEQDVNVKVKYQCQRKPALTAWGNWKVTLKFYKEGSLIKTYNMDEWCGPVGDICDTQVSESGSINLGKQPAGTFSGEVRVSASQ